MYTYIITMAVVYMAAWIILKCFGVRNYNMIAVGIGGIASVIVCGIVDARIIRDAPTANHIYVTGTIDSLVKQNIIVVNDGDTSYHDVLYDLITVSQSPDDTGAYRVSYTGRRAVPDMTVPLYRQVVLLSDKWVGFIEIKVKPAPAEEMRPWFCGITPVRDRFTVYVLTPAMLDEINSALRKAGVDEVVAVSPDELAVVTRFINSKR